MEIQRQQKQMNFEDFVYPLSREQISELAQRQPEVNNVVAGIKRDIWLTTMSAEDLVFQFIYINCKNEYKGYLLQLKFKQENFYSHITSYTFYLSREFDIPDPVQVYNSFLFQLRTGLESVPVHTVSPKEIKELKEKFGDPNPIMMSPFGIEVIPYVEKSQFYKSIMEVDENQVVEDGKKYVYLLLNSRNGYFKIGRSKNPLKREKTLQAEEPEIILIKYWEGKVTLKATCKSFSENKKLGVSGLGLPLMICLN